MNPQHMTVVKRISKIFKWLGRTNASFAAVKDGVDDELPRQAYSRANLPPSVPATCNELSDLFQAGFREQESGSDDATREQIADRMAVTAQCMFRKGTR